MDSILIDAPARTVAAALAEPWLLRVSLAPLGIRIGARVDQLASGDDLPVKLFGLPLRLRVEQADENGLVVSAGGVRVTASVAPTAVGTRLFAPRGLLSAVRARAEQLRSAPVVVGAVLVDGATVLAAQRDRPHALAGRWEFPGGKVEPGETEAEALVRECREELAVEIEVGDRVGPDLILASGWVLRLYVARLATDARPNAGEHRALRWVPVDEIDGLRWLDADRVVLPALRRLLAR